MTGRPLPKEPWRFFLFCGGWAFCVGSVVQFYHRRLLLGALCLFLMFVCWHYLGRPEDKEEDHERK